MEHQYSVGTGNSEIVWGSNKAVPLAYVEVRPCCSSSSSSQCCPSSPALTSAFVKLQLMRSTYRSTLLGEKSPSTIHMKWSEADKVDSFHALQRSSTPLLIRGSLVVVSRGGTTSEIEDDEGLLCFPSNDPACTELWPCECQGYGLVDATDAAIMVHISLRRRAVMVDGSTLVRIMPCHAGFGAPLMKSRLVGEVAVSVSEFQERAALAAQNPSTVQELSLRMRRLLSEPTRIGTTVDALEKCRQQKATRLYRERAIRAVFGLRGDEHSSTLGKMPKLVDYVATSTLFREGGLLVHSPEHGAGKTFLVETIARRLGAAVHVIQPGPLLAKYGVHADTALQCTIHAIAMEAAVRRQTVCIVLDSLDAMLPATHSSNTAGDAANPILHGIASYLQTLTTSLQQQRELPFPRNNPLYNLNGTNGAILPVRLCLVAVVTCPDDGRKLAGGDAVTAAMGIYRLPNLTSAARLSAFLWAFSEERIAPSPDLQQKLPFLAAAAVWSRGAVFYRIARQIRARVDSRHGSVTCSQSSKKVTVVVSLEDAEYAFNGDEKSYRSGCDVQFLADRNNMNESIFGVVGGNHEAKAALEDALALDPARRNLLASFGLSPATGILLYGPPGTGKTLLAKAVAKILRSGSRSESSSIGGAFVSLSSSEIVRSEVGMSEKTVLSAFQTARANAPSVVFIDEFQALFTERSSGGSSRLSTTLLQCMDDLHHWRDLDRRGKANEDGNDSNGDRVLVLAATNTPWMVDHAFLRPGRFDRAVHVGLPDSDERKSILRLHVGRMKTAFGSNTAQMLVLCDQIAQRTGGFSGADLAALCRASAILCLVEQSDFVQERHFFESLDNGLEASCSKALVHKINEWRP